MKILFHRHTEWQGNIRCSTNIFANLAKQAGHDVAYMHGMVHLGNLIARNGRWKYWKKGVRNEHGVVVFTPLSIIPFSRVFPFNSKWAAQGSYLSCLPSIKRCLDKQDFSPDIIWSANPGSIALKSLFPGAKFVFQVVDYYPAFSAGPIKQIEQADYEGADHIFVIGQTLKQYLVGELGIKPEKVTVLGQGVALEAYAEQAKLPNEYINLPRPIAVWVGVLDKCDPQLFQEAAKEMRELGGSLVLIGPGSGWAVELKKSFDHVCLLGAKKPTEVPAYLKHADIGLMLYDQKRQEIYEGQNPLKLYEYAAAGLPILSTKHKEYSYINAPVIEVEKVIDIKPAIHEALENSAQLKIKAKAFIEKRGWREIFSVAAARMTEITLDEK